MTHESFSVPDFSESTWSSMTSAIVFRSIGLRMLLRQPLGLCFHVELVELWCDFADHSGDRDREW